MFGFLVSKLLFSQQGKDAKFVSGGTPAEMAQNPQINSGRTGIAARAFPGILRSISVDRGRFPRFVMSQNVRCLGSASVLAWTVTFGTATIASPVCVACAAADSDRQRSHESSSNAPTDSKDQDADLGQPPSPVLDRGARTTLTGGDLIISGGPSTGVIGATHPFDPHPIRSNIVPVVVFHPEARGFPRTTHGPPPSA